MGHTPTKEIIAPLLLEMAVAARGISVPKFRTGLISELKKDSSPVSAIDRAVEQRMREFLPQAEKVLQTSVGFIGEEFPSVNLDAEFLFVVDPIDGTKPYLLGRSEWFTLIGLYQRGAGFVAGLCDQPDVDRAHLGVKNGGAWQFDRAGLHLHKAVQLPSVQHRNLKDSILLCFDPYMLPPAHQKLYEKLNARCMYAVPGGDAGNYARIAEGAAQIVFECVGGIYDIAAIAPFLQEVGATIIGLNEDGTQFVPGLDFGSRRTVLVTTSAGLQDEILSHL